MFPVSKITLLIPEIKGLSNKRSSKEKLERDKCSFEILIEVTLESCPLLTVVPSTRLEFWRYKNETPGVASVHDFEMVVYRFTSLLF